jgi:hypothetical protein
VLGDVIAALAGTSPESERGAPVASS